MEITREIDLHTFLPKDIPSVVEEYILEARKLGFSEVRIIHGKGIGYQRKVVQDLLAKHPGVKSFNEAPDMFGGRGATMAILLPQTNPFLASPGHSPHGSINRVPLCSLPGHPLENDLQGKTAYPSLSGKALELGVNGDWELNSPQAKTAVENLGALLGRVMGILLLGPKESRQQRQDWGADEWDWWAGVETIYLAGGCFRGTVGRQLLTSATNFLTEVLPNLPHLEIPESPEDLPLLGAWILGGRGSLSMDWGQTNLKAGHFTPGGQPSALRPWPMESPQWEDFEPGEEESQAWELHRSLLAFTQEKIRETAVCHGPLTISIANYVENGAINPRGAYGKLRLLSPNYQSFFEEELNRREGSQFKIRLENDGLCACTAVAPRGRTALILWGTALGIGWPREI